MRWTLALLFLAACRLGPEADAPEPAASVAPPLATVQAAVVPEAEPALDTLARDVWGQPMTSGDFRALVASVDTSVASGVRLLGGATTFHGDEAIVRDGERWQGLYPTEAGVELRSFTVTAETVYDVIVDDEDGPFTGLRVTTPFSEAPDEYGYAFDPAIALVQRGGRPFPAGSVPTAFVGSWPIDTGSVALSFGDAAPYRISAATGPEVAPGVPGERVVVLSDDSVNQAIAHIVNRDDGYPALLWAGDLDGDGRLDLLLDETDHYNVSLPTLYLSSAASEENLVGRVAQHETFGC